MTPTCWTSEKMDAIAWEFLESEFAGPMHVGWPIDRRLEVFLLHRGLNAVADDGSASRALLEHVMANIRPALRRGILHPRACAERS